MEQLHSITYQAIINGVSYLHEHQYPNGEFCCYIGTDDEMKMCHTQGNLFPTSLISYSLLNLRHLPEVAEVLEKATAYLQYQVMRGGVWNNFPVLEPLFQICPPDVDNTACASIVLQALEKYYVPNEEILLANRSKSGLFYTWFALRPNKVKLKDYWMLIMRAFKHPVKSVLFWRNTEASRYDIDAAVNANVLFYLGLNEHTAPIIPYLLKIVEQGKESDCDLWYRNPFTIYYFFSRIYQAGIKSLEPARQKMVSRILSTVKPDGSLGGSILDTALGIITLINWGYTSPVLDDAVQFLISRQGKSGGWPRWAVYYGGPKKQLSYGSEEMTTGFCVEALALYNAQKVEGNENI